MFFRPGAQGEREDHRQQDHPPVKGGSQRMELNGIHHAQTNIYHNLHANEAHRSRKNQGGTAIDSSRGVSQQPDQAVGDQSADRAAAQR